MKLLLAYSDLPRSKCEKDQLQTRTAVKVALTARYIWITAVCWLVTSVRTDFSTLVQSWCRFHSVKLRTQWFVAGNIILRPVLSCKRNVQNRNLNCCDYLCVYKVYAYSYSSYKMMNKQWWTAVFCLQLSETHYLKARII